MTKDVYSDYSVWRPITDRVQSNRGNNLLLIDFLIRQTVSLNFSTKQEISTKLDGKWAIPIDLYLFYVYLYKSEIFYSVIIYQIFNQKIIILKYKNFILKWNLRIY